MPCSRDNLYYKFFPTLQFFTAVTIFSDSEIGTEYPHKINFRHSNLKKKLEVFS
jgi:hypothetical protein